MPYAIRKSGNEWEVYNKGTGKSKGKSKSKMTAYAHMRKLYMVENGKMKKEK